MNRKSFLTKSLLSLGGIAAIPTALGSCNQSLDVAAEACDASPSETAGPFPIKTPAQWVRENIIGDRKGVPLMIVIKVVDVNNNCAPMEGVFVDIWHCDAQGNYSEYSRQLDGDFTNEHFLRGRQTTDENGNASFISIYPGWYPGRAPHLHFEILTELGKSLLVTQTAFPEEVSKTVYATADYNGHFDTSNARDGLFRDSLAANLSDVITGNIVDGYTLQETIKVKG